MQNYRYSSLVQPSQKLGGRYTRPQLEVQTVASNTHPDVPLHGSYGSLLFDPRWKVKRMEIIIRDNRCCVICRAIDDLQVHHRQYQFVKAENAFKMPWDYADHLFITLCKSCHQRGHSKFKVPILII
jgi:5-methylcytosine-specific restriction endonuclease McrA